MLFSLIFNNPDYSGVKHMPSIKEMRQVCQIKIPNKKGKMVYADHWWARYVSRHCSIYLTWLFVKLGISANAVTFLMILTGLMAFVLCIPHILWVNIIGLLLWFLFEALDCSDGEVARWTKKSSIRGVYLDFVSHVLCNHSFYAIMALHLYFWKKDVEFLELAFLTYAFSITSHFIFKGRIMGFAKGQVDYSRFWVKLFHYVNTLFSLLTQFVYLMVLLPVPLILSHVYSPKLMMFGSYVLMVLLFCRLSVIIPYHYYVEIPDVAHDKKAYIESFHRQETTKD